MNSPQFHSSTLLLRHHPATSSSKSNAPTKPDLKPPRQNTSYGLRCYHNFVAMATRNLQMIIVLVGLVVTALVQPLFVTFMILLWIGDEAFRSYFLKDIMALVTLSNPTGTLFELLMKWSTVSFVVAIVCLLICVTGYLKWKDQQNRGILSLIASPDFSNTLKPYFIVSFVLWMLFRSTFIRANLPTFLHPYLHFHYHHLHSHPLTTPRSTPLLSHFPPPLPNTPTLHTFLFLLHYPFHWPKIMYIIQHGF